MAKYPIYTKANIITDLETHTGEYHKIVCITPGTIEAIVSPQIQENGSDSITEVEILVNPDEPVLEGLLVTSIKLKDPGEDEPCSVIAYSY